MAHKFSWSSIGVAFDLRLTLVVLLIWILASGKLLEQGNCLNREIAWTGKLLQGNCEQSFRDSSQRFVSFPRPPLNHWPLLCLLGAWLFIPNHNAMTEICPWTMSFFKGASCFTQKFPEIRDNFISSCVMQTSSSHICAIARKWKKENAKWI